MYFTPRWPPYGGTISVYNAAKQSLVNLISNMLCQKQLTIAGQINKNSTNTVECNYLFLLLMPAFDTTPPLYDPPPKKKNK